MSQISHALVENRSRSRNLSCNRRGCCVRNCWRIPIAPVPLLRARRQRDAGRSKRLFLRARTVPLDVPLQSQRCGFCWGHLSSHDLIHWRHHPDAIGPGPRRRGLLQWWWIRGRRWCRLSDVLDAVGCQRNRPGRSDDADFDLWQKPPATRSSSQLNSESPRPQMMRARP